MSEFWRELQCAQLHKTPVDVLGLPATTIEWMNDRGIRTIGDCLDLYSEGGIGYPAAFSEFMFGEIRTKMREANFMEFLKTCTGVTEEDIVYPPDL